MTLFALLKFEVFWHWGNPAMCWRLVVAAGLERETLSDLDFVLDPRSGAD